DREDTPPEARGAVVVRLVAPERRRLEDYDEEREPHRQRREEVMVGRREGEVDAVGGDGVHGPTPPSRRSSEASPYSRLRPSHATRGWGLTLPTEIDLDRIPANSWAKSNDRRPQHPRSL